MGGTLQIRLLGGFQLVYGNTPVSGIDTPRLQSLVAYLALHRDVAQPRRQLAFLLWPDSDEAQARTNLRNLLHYLRRALPEADRFLHLSAQALSWQPDAPVLLDVARFEAAAAAGALDVAAALYTGDLLPDCYDDWIIPERERLRGLYTSVLERLVRQLEEARDYHAAIEQARRLLQLDPLREEPYRDLMRLFALSGDRAAAVHAYHTCADTLQRELGVEPGPATRQAYERLLSIDKEPDAAGPTPLSGVLPLVGRAGQWGALLAAWRAATAGGPRVAVVEGEAGIGKTRLAEELAAWSGRQGLRTAWADCYAPARNLAYAPVATWLRAGPLPPLEPLWLSEVARLLPELLARQPDLPPPGPLAEEWQRQRLYAALARAIMGAGQPLLLVLEDLQWCDPDTLAWLHYLLRFDPQARLLIVGTVRPDEVAVAGPLATLLDALDRDGLLTRIALNPLDEAETAALAGHAAGQALSAAEAAHLYQETEGNPLFVVEMVRAGVLARDGSRTAPTLPPRVQAVLAARLDALSPPARELLGVAAVVGREFTFDVLRHASGGDEEQLVRALDELWQRRLVRERGDSGYDFSHQRLREAAYMGLSAARRRLLHRRVAEALQAVRPTRVEDLAHHYGQAEDWEQAAYYHRLAGEQARRVYANEAALAHYDRALALAARGGLDAQARFELLARREAVLGMLGEREAQARDLEAMAALAHEALGPAPLARVRRRQARLLLDTGRYDESEAVAQQALDLARELNDRPGQAAALVALGMAADQRGDPARAIPHLRAAVDLCDGDEPTEASAERRRRRQAARVHRALASALLGLKEYASARAEAETALALQEALGDRLGQVEALNILGIVCMEQGMLDDATGCYWRALESCRAIGYRYGEARALGNWGNVLYVQGALDKALGRYDQAAAIFRDIGHRRGEAIVRLNTADIRLSVYGDVEHARADVEAVLAYAREAGEHATEGQSLTVLGQAAWQLGDLAEARHLLETSVAVLKEAGEQWLEAQACITLVHVRLDEGQPEAALADLLAVEAMCRERGMASLQGDLSTARGAVLLALGRPDEALAAIERAEEQPGSGVQRTYLAPYTRYRASRALGREPEARAAIEQAQQAVLDLIKGLSPQEQETSLRQQPEFRAIVETWQAACG